MNRIATDQHERVSTVWYSQEIQQLIDMMLEKLPEDRPTAEELIARVEFLMPNEDKSFINLDFASRQRMLS